MKLLNLSESAIEELQALPETGMGFQLVEATLWGNSSQLLVLNSEVAIDISQLDLSPSENISDILRNESNILNAMRGEEKTIFSAPSAHSFNLISTRISPPSISTYGIPIAATPSSLIKHVTLKRIRVFHRFSAFNPDRRVDPKTGDFLPGTYATVDSEVPFIPSGFSAVGRFALPNNQAASHLYVIEASAGTKVSFGTVAPAFSQAGGGVEAFFPNAVLNRQSPMKLPSKLPDE